MIEHNDVQDRALFAEYVAQLRMELDTPELVAKWENTDLRAFLDAMVAWSTDSKEPANGNPWRHAADVLTAATVYE